MKTKITLSFLVVLFCTVSIVAQKKVLFIGNTSTTPSATYLNSDLRDTLAIKKLQAQGFTVLFLGDDQTKVNPLSEVVLAAYNDCNALVISSTVGGGDVSNIATKAFTEGKPVLSWEPAAYDELKIMSGYNGVTPLAASATVNSAVGAPFIGSLTTFTFSTKSPIEGVSTSKGKILGAGVVNLATTIGKAIDGVTDTTIAVVSYLKLGEMGYGTETAPAAAATASTIAWSMFTNDNLPFISAEGWEMFLRAVCVLAEKVYAPTGIKDIASYDVNSKMWYANGNLNMDIWKNLKNSQLSIYNTEGKLISKTQITGSGLFSVPVSNLKNGLYMVVGEGFKGKFIKN